MTPPTHRRFARCLVSHVLVCVVLTLVAFSPSASAGTMVNATGSGSLSISTTGTLSFDAVDLDDTGSIDFRGRVVHVSSGLEASGSIMLNAGDVSIVDRSFPVGGVVLVGRTPQR